MPAGDGTTTPDSTVKADDPLIIKAKCKALSKLVAEVKEVEGIFASASKAPTARLGDAIDGALSSLGAHGKPTLLGRCVIAWYRPRPQ